MFFHRLHDRPEVDAYSFGRELPDARVSEILLNADFDPGGVVAMVQKGDGGQYVVYALDPAGHWVQVARYEDRIIAAAFGADHALYLVSRRDAPRGRILRLPPGNLKLVDAKVIVPEKDGTIAPVSELDVLPFTLTADRLYLKELVGGPSRVNVFFSLAGKVIGELPCRMWASVGEVVPTAWGAEVVYSIETFLRPRYYGRFDASTRKSGETKLVQTSPISFDDAEADPGVRDLQGRYQGSDQHRAQAGHQARWEEPGAALYGYGGYGISLVPRFLGAERRVWLDGGGIYAIANLRGGGEYGEDWHRQGALTHKQNVFDDFYARRPALDRARPYRRARLAIEAEATAGLLMGVELTQHPGSFRGGGERGRYLRHVARRARSQRRFQCDGVWNGEGPRRSSGRSMPTLRTTMPSQAAYPATCCS